MQSAVVRDEDGQGPPVPLGAAGQFDFGMMDADDDPELAMALRVSLEEQRLRQEQEARQQAPSGTTGKKYKTECPIKKYIKTMF